MNSRAKNKTKQREILFWGLFHIAFCFIRVSLSIRCNAGVFGNFLMFPKEISRSFLYTLRFHCFCLTVSRYFFTSPFSISSA